MKRSYTWMWVTAFVVIWTLMTVSVLAHAQEEPTPAPAETSAAVETPATPPAADLVPAGSTTEDGTGTPSEGEPGGSETVPATQPGTGTEETAPPPSPFDTKFMLIMVAVVVLYIFFITRSRKKQANKRKEQLDSVKPGAKVMTIGGLIGTVASVKDDEIVIKSGDQKLVFTRWAIRTVGEDVDSEKTDEQKQQ